MRAYDTPPCLYHAAQHWNNHTTRRPTSSTTHYHHTISYTMIAMRLLFLIICNAACCMPHVTCYNIGKCHIMAKGVGAATADATWGEAWCTNGGSRKNELVGVSAPFCPRGQFGTCVRPFHSVLVCFYVFCVLCPAPGVTGFKNKPPAMECIYILLFICWN